MLGILDKMKKLYAPVEMVQVITPNFENAHENLS